MSKKSDQKYRGNGEHAWEYVTDNTFRLRVPGGWVYRYGTQLDEAVAMTTVVMPTVVKHKV
jgi:hypothetical protein